jgi:hypothetical protein
MLLLGNPEGKRHLGGPRHRWVDNIKMDIVCCTDTMGGERWIGVKNAVF